MHRLGHFGGWRCIDWLTYGKTKAAATYSHGAAFKHPSIQASTHPCAWTVMQRCKGAGGRMGASVNLQ